MFEGRPHESKGMSCHLVIEYFNYHGYLWAWIEGGIWKKEWTYLMLLSPLSLLDVTLDLTPVEPPLLTIWL